jgi:asparagine synthetase B (glutamine-hydrolysing)
MLRHVAQAFGTTEPPLNRIQLVVSPFYGDPDLSTLIGAGTAAPLDPVSVADLLRNGFVYPPYSVYANVRLVSCGFDPDEDMFEEPRYRPLFQPSPRAQALPASVDDWASEYHQRLCGAVRAATRKMDAPWLLQSGGKDSTSLAIAIGDARPDTTCITYLGGDEENELDSADLVTRRLGLRHEALVCDPIRAYRRYLQLLPRMPLLTADFALLSYADLATEIVAHGGDGIIDGLGSDVYFGVPPSWHKLAAHLFARNLNLPRAVRDADWLRRNFKLSYVLSTLQMDPMERGFPGSRFTDAEVDALFGRRIAHDSRDRRERFLDAMTAARDATEQASITLDIMAGPGGFAKGLYTATALSLRMAYPYCHSHLWHWITQEMPPEQRMRNRIGKVVVREHIARRFPNLPYVQAKGSFRFNLRGLARQCYDEVYHYAERVRDVLPGASTWLEHNRRRMDNKYDASKFYLLAVVLPWLDLHHGGRTCMAQAPFTTKPSVDLPTTVSTPLHAASPREDSDASPNGGYLPAMASSSTSNISVAFGSIVPGTPRSP